MHIPKYRPQTGRDWAFVEYKKKRHRLPGKFDSPESRGAYAAFVARLVSEKNLPPIVQPGEPLTVSTLVLTYLDFCATYYGNDCGWAGEAANIKYALRRLKNAYGALPADSIGPLKLKAIQQELIGEGRSRNYINQVCAKIKRCYKWAASEELVPIAAYQGLATVSGLGAGRTKAKESPKRQPVPWEHVEPIIAELSPTVGTMLLMQWHTGARSGSICKARAEQFDTSGKVWLWYPRHKNEKRGQKLVLPIGPKCQAALRPFMQRAEYLFDPREARNHKAYGDHYTARSYRQAVKRAARRVNRDREEADKLLAVLIPDWTPHQVRHAKGHFVRNQYGAEAAQAVLGHENLKATEIYSEKRLGLATIVAAETG